MHTSSFKPPMAPPYCQLRAGSCLYALSCTFLYKAACLARPLVSSTPPAAGASAPRVNAALSICTGYGAGAAGVLLAATWSAWPAVGGGVVAVGRLGCSDAGASTRATVRSADV